MLSYNIINAHVTTTTVQLFHPGVAVAKVRLEAELGG